MHYWAKPGVDRHPIINPPETAQTEIVAMRKIGEKGFVLFCYNYFTDSYTNIVHEAI